MNTVAGLFLALIGLFLIWAWSSGRAEAIWQSLWAGSTPSGYGGSGATSATATASQLAGALNAFNNLPSLNPGITAPTSSPGWSLGNGALN